MNIKNKIYLTNSFFITLFFVTLRIGETSHRIPTYFLFISFFVYLFITNKTSLKVFKVITFIFILTFLHFIISIFFQKNFYFINFFYEKLFWFFQYIILLLIIIYLAFLINEKIFLKSYFKIGKISIYFVYISLLLSIFIKSGIGADVWSNGWIRPHGFFSEPSNLVYVLPGFLMEGIINKKKINIILIILTIILTLSPTVYGVTLITYLLYFYSSLTKIKKLIYIIFIILVVFSFVIYGYTLYSNFDSSNALSFSIQRLIGGVLKITNNDDSMSNSRADLAYGWYNFINQNPFALYFGFGLGVSNAYAPYFNDGMTLDSSIIIMLINSFGLLIMLVILGFIIFAIYLSRSNKVYQWIFIPIFVGQIFNPSGVYYQYLVLLLMILILKKHFFLNNEK